MSRRLFSLLVLFLFFAVCFCSEKGFFCVTVLIVLELAFVDQDGPRQSQNNLLTFEHLVLLLFLFWLIEIKSVNNAAAHPQN